MRIRNIKVLISSTRKFLHNGGFLFLSFKVSVILEGEIVKAITGLYILLVSIHLINLANITLSGFVLWFIESHIREGFIDVKP